MPEPVKIRKRRVPKTEEVLSRKMIQEEGGRFLVHFPKDQVPVLEKSILSIAGARKIHDIRWEPKKDAPEEQIELLAQYSVPKSDENLQTVAKFGKSHRFTFGSDLAVRAWSSSSEGRELEKLSFAEKSDFAMPKLGGTLLPFQPAGVEYLHRVERGFLADEMGLGKTVQLIAGIAKSGEYPWLIVVPKNLKLNWMRELHKWLKPVRVKGKTLDIHMLHNDDFEFTRQGTITPKALKRLRAHHIVLVNYDRLIKWKVELSQVAWHGVIFDESHYLKSKSAKRVQATRDMMRTLSPPPKFIWMATGTPLLNQPQDMLNPLRILGRIDDFGGPQNFLNRYCTISAADPETANKAMSAVHRRTKREALGTDAREEDGGMSGQKTDEELINRLYENMTRLNAQLRSSCYIRRDKSDVLKDLPEKTRSTVPLDITNREEYKRIEEDVVGYLVEKAMEDKEFLKSIKKMPTNEQQAMLSKRRGSAAMIARRGEALRRLNALKFAAAVGKLEYAKQWIQDYLDSGKKLVVFCHHNKIRDELIDAFPQAVNTRGSDKVRDEAVQRFIEDPKCNLFIGSLKRDGVGLTLHANGECTATATIEFGWTPALHDQAEDRVHRIGQTNAVTAYYLVAARTIEERIGKLIERKRQIVNAVADGDPLKGLEQGSVLGDLMQEIAESELELWKPSAKRRKKKAVPAPPVKKVAKKQPVKIADRKRAKKVQVKKTRKITPIAKPKGAKKLKKVAKPLPQPVRKACKKLAARRRSAY